MGVVKKEKRDNTPPTKSISARKNNSASRQNAHRGRTIVQKARSETIFLKRKGSGGGDNIIPRVKSAQTGAYVPGPRRHSHSFIFI